MPPPSDVGPPPHCPVLPTTHCVGGGAEFPWAAVPVGNVRLWVWQGHNQSVSGYTTRQEAHLDVCPDGIRALVAETNQLHSVRDEMSGSYSCILHEYNKSYDSHWTRWEHIELQENQSWWEAMPRTWVIHYEYYLDKSLMSNGVSCQVMTCLWLSKRTYCESNTATGTSTVPGVTWHKQPQHSDQSPDYTVERI